MLLSTLVGGDRTLEMPKVNSDLSFFNSKYATVSQPIKPGRLGRIYYQSTYWFGCALSNTEIPEGTIVEVIERQGTVWFVKPVSTDN